jgi:mannose-6-phosphate isomerase
MHELYPLQFEPILKRYVWGGRKLGTLLGKPIGEGEDYAESWEVVDREVEKSVIRNGPLRGKTLREVIAAAPAEFYGAHAPEGPFPLLFKFLDAQRNLSVQVHPNDEQGKRLPKPDLGKTEAWVVMQADEGAKIYAGLKRGFDRHAFERELHRGTVELCLNTIEPKVGDCVFIPAGTVHALGAGLVIAEIQQNSDTTFRVYDWNRVGADGKPRPLHIEESLATIDFERGPVSPVTPEATSRPFAQRLVACDKFVMERLTLRDTATLATDDKMHLIAVLSGSATISGYPDGPLTKGAVCLLPARPGWYELTPQEEAVVLDIWLP